MIGCVGSTLATTAGMAKAIGSATADAFGCGKVGIAAYPIAQRMLGLSSVAIGEAEIGPEMGGLVESGDGAVELAIVGVRRAGLDLRRDRRSAGVPAERGQGPATLSYHLSR